jgi:ABC-type transport system substrate-binding protein
MEGSGPYALTELQENQAVLQLRPGYGGQINRVQLLQVASEAKFRLLQEGKLDIVRNLWDVRMQQRVDLLGGYEAVPFSTSVDSYLLVNPEQRPDLPISKPSQRLALLLTIAGRPLSNLQQAALPETGALVLYYFQGVEDNVRYENRRLAEELAAPLIKAGLTVSYSAVDWPELARRATTFDYDLLLLPAPTNNRLPDQVVLLDDANAPDASALVARYRDEVYLVCHRLAQLTINPNGHPFAAAKGSWTDRIENIRIIASGDAGHEEALP